MDLGILHWIQDSITHPVLIELFKVITALGNGGIIWFIYAGILVCQKRKKEALFLILTLGLTSLLVNGVLKHLVLRARPFVTDPTLIPRISPPSSTSFPSGHSATSLCCSAFLLLTDKTWLGKSAAVTGILIACSRLVLLVHYPTDVMAGSLVGIAVGLILFQLMKRSKTSV